MPKNKHFYLYIVEPVVLRKILLCLNPCMRGVNDSTARAHIQVSGLVYEKEYKPFFV